METSPVIYSNSSLELLLLKNVFSNRRHYLLGTPTTHSQTFPTAASNSAFLQRSAFQGSPYACGALSLFQTVEKPINNS